MATVKSPDADRGENAVADREPTTTVVRPRVGRAVFGERLAAWLEEGVAARRRRQQAAGATTAPGSTAVVLVPEYVHGAAPAVLADLAAADWTGTVVTLAGYGGRTRGRYAIEDAREVLDAAGADVLDASLGIDAARVRAEGFTAADVVLRDLLLDELGGLRPPTARTPARSTPRG
jgi:NAD(P)H-dependent FMN reductase